MKRQKELKDKSQVELSKLLLEKQEALRAFRFNISGSKTKNVKEGRMLRKDIARIMTMNTNMNMNRSHA